MRTLNQVLAELGYTTTVSPFWYKKNIINSDGVVVFTGDAHHVWQWLRDTKQYTEPKPVVPNIHENWSSPFIK